MIRKTDRNSVLSIKTMLTRRDDTALCTCYNADNVLFTRILDNTNYTLRAPTASEAFRQCTKLRDIEIELRHTPVKQGRLHGSNLIIRML